MSRKNVPKWMILIVIICGCFMANLDTSVVNLAISNMMSTFGSSVDQIQWVLSGYTLAMGMVVAASGYLCDKLGIRKVFAAALTLFTFGSFLCGISWSTTMMIAFRVLQGLGGGLIIPTTMIILMDNFNEEERPSALGIFGVFTLAAPAMGPTVGGYIIQYLSWRYVFFINIPIGILGVILAIIILNDEPKGNRSSFDLIGFLTSGIGLSLILYVCGNDNINWSDLSTIILITMGCFSLLMFVVNELMIPSPMLDLKLLKNYVFCMSNILMCISLFALFGGVFLVPMFLQKIRGLTALQTGLILFPEGFAQAISMVLSTKLTKKFSGRTLAIFSLLLIGINGYGLSKLTLDTPNTTITLLLMIRGLGMGCLMGPVQLLALNAVPKEMSSNASAILNTIKQVGVSIGITLITRIMQAREAVNYASIAEHTNRGLLKTIGGLWVKGGLPSSQASSGALAAIYGLVVKKSSVDGVNDTMLIISIISFIAIIPASLLQERKAKETP